MVLLSIASLDIVLTATPEKPSTLVQGVLDLKLEFFHSPPDTEPENNIPPLWNKYKNQKFKQSKRLRYRIIDFKRNRFDDISEVLSIEYDPNRSAFIALTKFDDNEKRYIVALKGLKVGDKIVSGSKKSPDIGNCMPLSDIPLGTIISCIEMRPGKGAAIARSAGSFAQLMAKDGKFVTVKMPSGETRLILSSCYATIGSVSNSDHQLTVFGKAGSKRWLGRRPRTRPVAMNPVDHPMGGGEGRASGGHPRSKNGIPAKGFRTRDKKKASNKYIIERKKK